MKKTFLTLVLEYCCKSQAQAARMMEWSPQRVNYLCSEEAIGFPFEELLHLKDRMVLSQNELTMLLANYFKGQRAAARARIPRPPPLPPPSK